jgi:hypothetical protein
VDVAERATPTKLAEHYGLLILHWSRDGVETFVVQDEATSQRFRVAAASRRGRNADSERGVLER